jgi:hypothetical protein
LHQRRRNKVLRHWLQILFWKNPDQDGSRKFSPLLWAVVQNQPEIVEILLDKGADADFAGCCLDNDKAWICGNAFGLAKHVMI